MDEDHSLDVAELEGIQWMYPAHAQGLARPIAAFVEGMDKVVPVESVSVGHPGAPSSRRK